MFRRIVIAVAATATLATAAAPAAQAARRSVPHAPRVAPAPQPEKPAVGILRSSWS